MRIWEILEKHDEYGPRKGFEKGYEKDYDREYDYPHKGSRMGMKSSEHDYKKLLMEVYECGFEEGYGKAMKEAEHLGFKYDERRGMR